MVIFLLKKSLFFENRDFFEKKPKNRVNFYPQKMAIFQKKWKSWYLHCPAIFWKNLRIKTGGPKNDPPGGQNRTPRRPGFRSRMDFWGLKGGSERPISRVDPTFSRPVDPPPGRWSLFVKSPGRKSPLFLKKWILTKKGRKNGSNLFPLFLGIFHFLVPHKDFTFSKKFADKNVGSKKWPPGGQKSAPGCTCLQNISTHGW